MWLLVAREPRPDAPEWPGRRLLAAVDAVAWPLMWVLLIRQVPGPAGLVGPFVTALAVLTMPGALSFEVLPVPCITPEVKYQIKPGRHAYIYVSRIRRDPIFTDLFRKLANKK